MSVTLSDVKRAARAHRAPLAGESAGYLVLAVADQVVGAPRRVNAEQVEIAEDGGLRVLNGQAISDADAERSLRELLDSLLLVASSGSAALSRAARRTDSSGLTSFVAELEAALIPVNRAAARRALARLHRETTRALASGTVAEASPVVPPVAADLAPAPAAQLPNVEIRAVLEPDHVVEPSADSSELSASDAQEFTELSVCDLEVEPIDDKPIEDDPIDDEPDALTIALDVSRRPALPLLTDECSQSPVALPAEACTRPEPVVLRRSQRPPAPITVSAAPVAEPDTASHTPTLGSLAAELPQLAPDAIAEIERARQELDDAAQVLASVNDEATEPTPEVAELEPGAALVPGKRSDVRELLAGFQVAEVDANPGLCRAIKEMADLDLTPAPFTALMRKAGS